MVETVLRTKQTLQVVAFSLIPVRLYTLNFMYNS